MLVRTLGSTIVMLAVCTLGLQAEAQKDSKEIIGKVKSVNVEKSIFTITTDGKDRTFTVTTDTTFLGPKGGVSEDGLKDDRMATGNEVKVIPASDTKSAKEVRLSIRKKAEEIVGTVKSINIKKSTFTITADGKDRTFIVTKETKFVGPKGGVSDDGLKDDRMAKGNEVKVLPASDEMTAREVTLPFRKGEKK
jgi:hypothetical protein